MLSPRESPEATVLADGRVLVSGGRTADGGFDATTSVEIFDPRSGHWTAAAPMRIARAYHTSTLLPTGSVLVAGNGGDEADSAEIYEPSANRWSAAARMGGERRSHVALRLADGQVLVLGGLAGSATMVGTAELYDPRTDRWSPAGAMGGISGEVMAALLADHRVLLIAESGESQLYKPSGD